MRNLCSLVLLATVLIAAAACDPISHIQTTDWAAAAPKFNTTPCTDSIAAIRYSGQVNPDPLPIARNCSTEACNDLPDDVLGVGFQVLGGTDSVTIRCANNTFKTIGAQGCWDCAESCAGSACPSGYTCYTIPNQSGSDCVPFTCAEGYSLRESNLGPGHEPHCRRDTPCPIITASISGPSKIRTGTQCTWTASATGGSGNYTYQWYNGTFYLGSGPSYTGGLMSGNTNGQFYLRVIATENGIADDAEILVKESATAPYCPT